MGFLIRTGFWFSLVLLILPLDAGKEGGSSVGALETFAAARQAIIDVSGLCERNPGVCETGAAAMHTVGVRAREAARIAYELLDERYGDKATDAPAVAANAKSDEPAAYGAEATADDLVTGGIEQIIRDAAKAK